jgi:hypothetical protein
MQSALYHLGSKQAFWDDRNRRSSQPIDSQKVEPIAMARTFNLTDIFKWVVDQFNNLVLCGSLTDSITLSSADRSYLTHQYFEKLNKQQVLTPLEVLNLDLAIVISQFNRFRT